MDAVIAVGGKYSKCGVISVALSYRRRRCANLAPHSHEIMHPRSQRRVHRLKHIIQVMQATLRLCDYGGRGFQRSGICLGLPDTRRRIALEMAAAISQSPAFE